MDEVSKKWAVEKVIPIKLSFKQFKSLGLLIQKAIKNSLDFFLFSVKLDRFNNA